MKAKPPECQRQACPPKKASGQCEFDRWAGAGSEANIHEASFFERRLFYLIRKLCYKETE